MTVTHPPAGWYPDPESDGMLRYWDGMRWTDHMAPGEEPHAAATAPAQQPAPQQPRKRGLSTGAIVAIVVGGLVVVGLVIAMLAAVAVPVFLNQQGEARDSAARAEAASIGIAMAGAVIDSPAEVPEVDLMADGTQWIVTSGGVEYGTVDHFPDVELEVVRVVPEEGWFCVQTRAVDGNAGPVHYDAWTGVADGPCPSR